MLFHRDYWKKKFLQEIPIVGVAGGLADTVYLKKITDYAELKYKRRFLKIKGKCD